MAAGHADLALAIAVCPRLGLLDKLLSAPSTLGELVSEPFALDGERIFGSWHGGSPLRRLRRLRPYRTSRPTAIPACSYIGTSGTASTPPVLSPCFGKVPRTKRGVVMIWSVWLLLMCLVLSAVLAPGDTCHCGHCRGRGCGTWCQWCR
jgi:hypothetical protein